MSYTSLSKHGELIHPVRASNVSDSIIATIMHLSVIPVPRIRLITGMRACTK
jgi:hypothetical protein